MKRFIQRVLLRGPEIVISMGALGFLMLAGAGVYLRSCGVGEPVFAQDAGLDGGRGEYRHDGPALLNNLGVTPGDVTSATAGQLCSKGFHTGDVRNVSQATKHKVCALYGIDKAHCVGLQPDGSGYEIDHLISLELGGSNDFKNLWPQPYNPKPSAKEKDVVENWLHAQVCLGKIGLSVAQQEIALDWYQVFLKAPAGAGQAEPKSRDEPGEK